MAGIFLLFIPVIYFALIVAFVYFTRWVFKIQKMLDKQSAMIEILAEIAVQQGCSKDKIDSIRGMSV